MTKEFNQLCYEAAQVKEDKEVPKPLNPLDVIDEPYKLKIFPYFYKNIPHVLRAKG